MMIHENVSLPLLNAVTDSSATPSTPPSTLNTDGVETPGVKNPNVTSSQPAPSVVYVPPGTEVRQIIPAE